MRLFRSRSLYGYAFSLYALNALFLLTHHAKHAVATAGAIALVTLAAQLVGISLVAFLAFAAIRSTSSGVEKAILVLTGALCLLILLGALPALSHGRISYPFHRRVFTIISCAAALLAGFRLVQVVTERNNSEELSRPSL